MIQSSLACSDDPIVGPMIGLARCSKHHRIVVAGTKRSELMFDLHRRGYGRVATTTTCGLPDGQYDVALVDWRQHSIKALETTLDWLVHFLTPSGVLVAWLDPQERAGNRTLRAMLEEHGLVVEAGTVRARSPTPRESQPCPRPDVTFCGSPAMRLRCRRHSTMRANSICLRLNVSVIVRSRAGQPRWWCVERRVKLRP